MPYSIVKMDDSYIIRVGDQDFFKVNSRRKAAKLISDLQRSEIAGDGEATEDGGALPDESEELRAAAVCCERED